MYTAAEIIKKKEELIEHKRYVDKITNEIYEFISKPENFNKKEYVLHERALGNDAINILESLGYKVEIKEILGLFNTVIKW